MAAGGEQPQVSVSGEDDPATVEGPGSEEVLDSRLGMRELGLAAAFQLDIPDGDRSVGGPAREEQRACVGRPRNPAERSPSHVGVGESLDLTAERRHEKDPGPPIEFRRKERDPAAVGRPPG